MVSIVGADLSELVGRDGEVLDALQELTRLAVLRETGERSRLMLDIAGYRARAAARSSPSWAARRPSEVKGSRRAGPAGADDARSSARSCTTPSRPPGCAASPRAWSPAATSSSSPADALFHVKPPAAAAGAASGCGGGRCSVTGSRWPIAYAEWLVGAGRRARAARTARGPAGVGTAPAQLRAWSPRSCREGATVARRRQRRRAARYRAGHRPAGPDGSARRAAASAGGLPSGGRGRVGALTRSRWCAIEREQVSRRTVRRGHGACRGPARTVGRVDPAAGRAGR